MAVTTTNLGVITAYGDAVAAGYTGTKAEWQALMASYATVGQQAVDAKNDAVAAKNTAVSKATEATTAASTATTKANEASASAQSIAQSAAQIQENTDSIDQLMSEITDKSDTADMLKAFPTDTASGSVASFADGANVPVKSLVVNIDPVQSGSGDPSPDNVRPISGWSEVNVNACGVNVWNEEYVLNSTINPDTGAVSAGDRNIRSKNYIPVIPNTDYYIKSNIPVIIVGYDANMEYVGVIVYGNPNSVFTTKKNNVNKAIHYIRFGTYGNNYGTTYNHDISINYPSTDHDYHPYSGQSINIALGQTVYGGTLDVTNGVLTTYPYYASYNGETLTGLWISDRDKYVSGATPTTGAQVVNIGGAGTDVQLDPHEVTALLGSNNVWADSGDSEVTYRADPTLYIGRLTEPDADMVADSNITSGQYFMVGNTLYKATANIASGGAITPNVNCTRKSLSEALNELNA
jgi:hypothetical protein